MKEDETGIQSNTIHKSKLKIDQIPECMSWNYRTLRRKHKQKSLECKHEQLFSECIPSGKGNKSKNEQVGLYQAKKLLYSKRHHQ